MKKEEQAYIRYTLNRSDARWASAGEIKNSPTVTQVDIEGDDCPTGGLPVISDGRSAYVDGSDTHTLIFGSTGSKKTRLFCMPLINILAMAGESFIATDPKGELHQKTSGLVEAKGYATYVLDFRDLTRSDYWNPLAVPYELYHSGRTDEAISFINDFISALAEPQRSNTRDIYFIEMAVTHALANMLFFIATAKPEEANIFNFVNFCTTKATAKDAQALYECLPKTSIAAVNYKAILANSEAEITFANIVSTMGTMLNSFIMRKTLCQVLSQSSFDVRELGNTKTAIYIIVPDEKTTLHFLVTAFIKQTYETLINEAQQKEDKRLPVRLNFIMDEFCNIPAIPDMAPMISAARSRNMRFFLIAQSMWQLRQKYREDADTIKSNCDNWVFLTSREVDLLDEISRLCGSTQYSNADGSVSHHPLISVSELQRFKKEEGEALILHGRHYPFVTNMPDIDDYAFLTYPPIDISTKTLPQIVPYNPDEAIGEIRASKRPVPYSLEAYGELRFRNGKPVAQDDDDDDYDNDDDDDGNEW